MCGIREKTKTVLRVVAFFMLVWLFLLGWVLANVGSKECAEKKEG